MPAGSVTLCKAALAAVVILLTACSNPIPTQPPTSQPSRQAAPTSAAPSAKPSTQARFATVQGTGRFGLSVRNAPGLTADRVATVPDGFQASVRNGPVGKDGADWYQIEAPDVAGWASGAYLAITTGQPPSPRPTASIGSAVGPDSPLSGLLSQLNRDANYDVAGNGIFVEARLKPAVDHLAGSKSALSLLRKAAPAYLRLTVAHFAATSEGGEFSTLGHSIKIADSILPESLDVQSTVISHELQHAVDILVDHAAPDTAQDCINLEVRAFRTQEVVWLEITKPTPPQTKMENELDRLSHIVNNPAFPAELGKLYASECNAYAGSTRFSPPSR